MKHKTILTQRSKRNSAFTLVELMVVIVIIGVLAAVAIPKFASAIDKSKAAEAPTFLSMIATAEDVVYAEETKYEACASHDELNSKLGVDAHHTKYFVYTTTATDTTFLAKASLSVSLAGLSLSGSYVSVDEDNDRNATPNGLYKLVRAYVGEQSSGSAVMLPPSP